MTNIIKPCDVFAVADKIFLSLIEPKINQATTVQIDRLFNRERTALSNPSSFEESFPISDDPANPFFVIDIVTIAGEYYQVRTVNDRSNLLRADNDFASVYRYTHGSLPHILKGFFRMPLVPKGIYSIEGYAQARDNLILNCSGGE